MSPNLLRALLKRLLRKSYRRTITLSGPKALSNDDFEIRFEGLEPHPDRSYLLLRFATADTVVVTYYDGRKLHEETRPFSEIPYPAIKVMHHFKTWRIIYSNPLTAVLWDALGINHVRWLFQRQYDRSLSVYKDRHGLLQVLVEMRHPWAHEPLRLDEILTRLYGSRILLSDRLSHVMGNLRFHLQSLVVTDDIKFDDSAFYGRVTVLPRALVTLADYEVRMSQHRDMKRVNTLQVLVAVGSLMLAAVAMYLRLSGKMPEQ